MRASVVARWAAGAVAVLFVSAAALADEKAKDAPPEAKLLEQAAELNTITGLFPLDGKLQSLIASPETSKKLVAAAAKQLKGKKSPYNRNATLLLSKLAEALKMPVESGAFYRVNIEQCKAINSERGVIMGYFGLVDMFQDNRRWADAEKAATEYLALGAPENSLMDRLRPEFEKTQVRMMALTGKTKEALAGVGRLLAEDPGNWELLALKALIYRESERFDDAADTILATIKSIEKNRKLDEDVRKRAVNRQRYILSGVYTEMNKIDKAAEQLKSLLEEEPNNPTYNNDLGYIWADRNINLDEAEKLIRKALEEDRKIQKKARDKDIEAKKEKPREVKDNGAYLDSLGWVLFKRNKAADAKPLLLEAVKGEEGSSLEIFDHLGDVHWALGEKAEAVAAWRKGLDSLASSEGPPSRRDKKRKAEVEKKLKMNEK